MITSVHQMSQRKLVKYVNYNRLDTSFKLFQRINFRQMRHVQKDISQRLVYSLSQPTILAVVVIVIFRSITNTTRTLRVY